MNRAYNQTRELAIEIALYGLLLLFFFQLLTDFVEAIYAFGLLGTNIPLEIVAVLLFFSPLVLIFQRGNFSGWSLVVLGELVILSRALEVLADTRGKMLVSGLGVACFLIFLPALLRNLGQRNRKYSGFAFGGGLTMALSLSILLRASYSGLDLSTSSPWRWIGWLLAILSAVLSVRVLRPRGEPTSNANAPQQDSDHPGRIIILSLGLIAVFVLLYFAFATPHVIARWTGESYLGILALLVVTLFLFSLLLAQPSSIRFISRPGVLWGWNILFVLALVATLYAHQIDFPSNPDAYPLFELAPALLARLSLVLALILSPIVLVDFSLYTGELVRLRPSSPTLGMSFTLGALFLVVMILAHVFTTVYDYIPVIGPFFRDQFWLVHLAAGVILVLPQSAVKIGDRKQTPAESWRPVLLELIGFVALSGALSLLVAYRNAPNPIEPSGNQSTLKVLTYNIQQGYSEDGLKNHTGQLDLIRELDPDIIGLQESDTNRISGGNSDVVRYFADRLNMYSYYGPKTATGTFGIALLSKYPLENPRTFFMYSQGEQTATIEARVTVGGEIFNLYVTHLGNEGPIVQQEAILQEINGKENVIAIGDFNFRPDSDQYRLTVERLEDAWLLKWSQGIDDRGVDPVDHIDYAFLSTGMEVRDARYIYSPASDHPALIVSLGW